MPAEFASRVKRLGIVNAMDDDSPGGKVGACMGMAVFSGALSRAHGWVIDIPLSARCVERVFVRHIKLGACAKTLGQVWVGEECVAKHHRVGLALSEQGLGGVLVEPATDQVAAIEQRAQQGVVVDAGAEQGNCR